ncbi:MAG: tyrosine-type recombinase/integrase, partial [Faecalibacillus intestinalis]
LGSIYDDNNLVICFEDGNPIEKTNIEKRFKKFIKVNNLREVVFHSLRHSSATYKLKLSKGDIKATQGDTGHKSADMITKRYAHIIDEDRKVNATKFEDEFYASKENEEKDDASELLDILKNNDALREQLKKMLSL